MIGILQKKHLIERWGHPVDTRKKCVRLTELGRKTLEITMPRAQAAADDMLGALSEQEAVDLLKALNKIADKGTE